MKRISWQLILASALCLLAAAMLPLTDGGTAPFSTIDMTAIFALILGVVAICAVGAAKATQAIMLFFAAHGAAWLLLTGIAGNEGTARLSFFALVAAAWLLAWSLVTTLSTLKPRSRQLTGFLHVLIPLIFGVWVLILWRL